MTQDNFNNQNYLQEEDSMDIKKEAGYYLFFLALFFSWYYNSAIKCFFVLKNR